MIIILTQKTKANLTVYTDLYIYTAEHRLLCIFYKKNQLKRNVGNLMLFDDVLIIATLSLILFGLGYVLICWLFTKMVNGRTVFIVDS